MFFSIKSVLPLAVRGIVLVVSVLLSVGSARAQGIDSRIPQKIDCSAHRCGEVLPLAASFREVEGKPWFEGLNADEEVVGWVVLSTDVVDIKAYSGKPLVTLVGLNKDGVITGAHVVNHAEPILLVGIPEARLHDFVAFYKDKPATKKIVVGRADEGVTSVDAISGATVTALAQNQTILETAVALGTGTGAIAAEEAESGQFVQGETPWTWAELWENRAIGRLYVTQEQMGSSGDEPFIDLLFTIADAPHVGISLLGPSEYRWYMDQLQAGEHLLVVLGNGTSSFKGSGFVRGGIFDRVRVEQGLRSVLFTDKDYKPLAGVYVEGAGTFKEGAVFTVRRGTLDPGREFDLVFLGSVYNHKGGFGRDFRAINQAFQLPDTVYKANKRPAKDAVWRQAWRNNGVKVSLLAALLIFVVLVFSARRFTTARKGRLLKLHEATMLAAVVGIGFGLGVQPSITQVLTFIDGAMGELRWDLFLSEPLLFVFWIFIFSVSLIWGRGVFCGWTCPYGALNELLFKVGEKLGVKPFELPEAIHQKAKYLRYVVLVVLVAAYMYRPELGERMAEVEPFKSTFYVAPWTREIGFLAWWLLLLGLAVFWWRPFCRYVCPLGAGLAILGSFRLSGPYRRQGCETCKVCTTTCEPRAIDAKGKIDPRECLSCMECEANFRDHEVCPPLIGIDRLLKKPEAERRASDGEKLERLRELERRV